MAFVITQLRTGASRPQLVGTEHNPASSIGATWPPKYDEHNRRVKGFSTSLVEGPMHYSQLMAEARKAHENNPSSERTTFRAFVSKQYEVANEGQFLDAPFRVEATIPVPGLFGGSNLVYFAHTWPDRCPDEMTFRLEMDSIRKVQQMPRTNSVEAEGRVAEKGYRLETLKAAGNLDLDALLRLYTEAYTEYTFAITPATIGDMLSNGNIIVVGRSPTGEIVSALVAEHCSMRVVRQDGAYQDMHIFELSDYATLKAHRGHGLMTLMQIVAVREITAKHGSPNSVIYAEDRAPWEAVNISSQKAGLNYCGTLLNHCAIVSDRSFGEVGRYESLNVWAHVPRINGEGSH